MLVCRATPLLSKDYSKGDDGCKIPVVMWESYCRNLRIIEGNPLQDRNRDGHGNGYVLEAVIA